MTLRFQKENGKHTSHDDPNLAMWYGPCGYWTDDWAKLTTFGPGIPCCPKCGSPGFQTTAKAWLSGATRFEGEGHPGYRAFVNWMKERCGGKEFDWFEAYEKSDFARGPRRG